MQVRRLATLLVAITVAAGCAGTGSKQTRSATYLVIGGALLAGLVIGIATDDGGVSMMPRPQPIPDVDK